MRTLKFLIFVVTFALSVAGVSFADSFSLPIERNHQIEEKYELYHLLAAYAFRQQDLTYCKAATHLGRGVEECVDRVHSYDLLVNVVKGNCEAIDRDSFKVLCQGVKKDGKGMKNETIAAIYQGLKNEDFQAIERASWKPYWAFREEIMSEDTARYFLSFYKAYQNDSIQDVGKYLDKNHPNYIYQMATFDILFSPEFSSADLVKLYDLTVKKYEELEYLAGCSPATANDELVKQ